MKTKTNFIRLLLVALLVCLLASVAAAVNANSASALSAALAAGNETVTLTANITYDGLLNVPSGTTLNLNGKNLYVTGLTNNGTISKNGGKLWASVSSATTLRAKPTAKDLSNFWSANEELLNPYTDLDGILITKELAAYDKPVSTVTEREKTYTPRLYAAGAYVGNASLFYANARIPSGKTLDLGGNKITLRAIGNSFGEGRIVNGTISLMFYGIENSVPNLKSAVALAKERSGIVTNFYQSTSQLTYTTGYSIPTGVTLTKSTSDSVTIGGTVVFDYIDADDMAREGSNYATQFVQVVSDKASLDSALQNSASTITLGNNIEYGDHLTIPNGKTLNLNGYSLYVTNLTKNGTLTKSGGKLWVDVNSNATLMPTSKGGSASQFANMQNLWVADNELCRSGTDFDGIRIVSSTLSTYRQPLTSNGASATSENDSDRVADLPYLNTAGGFPTNKGIQYAIAIIPAGKYLDLNGNTVEFKATRATMGSGTIYAHGGGLILSYYNPNNSTATMKNCITLYNERGSIVKRFYQTSGVELDLSGQAIPANVELKIVSGTDKTSGKPFSATNITLACADRKDFSRTGAELADKFTLSDNIYLSQNLNIGSRDFDFNGYSISGPGIIQTTGTITYNGGGYGTVVTDETELRAAASDPLVSLIRLDANIALSDDVDLGAKNFDFVSYDLTGGTIKTTGFVSSSEGGGNMRTATTATEFWSIHSDMQTNDKITVLRLGADIDLGSGQSSTNKISIPDGKQLDLVGHTLQYRPYNSALGTIVDTYVNKGYAGHFILQYVGPSSSGTYAKWKDAVALANNYPGLVTEFVLAATVGSTSDVVVVPSGVYISGKTITAKTLTFRTGATTALSHKASTIVYECANAADFTRLFFTKANVLRLSADIRDDDLTVRVRKGQTLDLNGHKLFCEAVMLDDGAKITENGGALRRSASVSTAAELADALQVYTDITLSEDINAPAATFTVPLRATLDLNGHNLTCQNLRASYGGVLDSADGVGKITASTCFDYDVESNYVPLRDGESYRFFHVESNLRRAPETTETGALRFAFRYRFSNADANELIAGGNSGLKFYVNLRADGKTLARFVFGDDLIRAYAERTAQGRNVILRFDLVGRSQLGGEVYTDAYLTSNVLAVESHAAEAGAAQKRYFETDDETDLLTKTVAEIKKVDENILREAIVRTAFAYYDKNPYTQYGMTNDNGYVKNLYTGYDSDTVTVSGKQYKTKITQGGSDYYFFSGDNGQFSTLFATRAQYGHRRPFGLSPEQVWADNLYISQCSGFPYFVYYNTFLNTDGSPYEIYGGHLTYNGGWTGSNSDNRRDMTVLAWLDLNNAASSSYAPYGSENDFATELSKISTLQAGDILHSEGHIMLCIGDYDNDGYIELIHSWPVKGDIETYNSDSLGNLTPSTIYHLSGSSINTSPYRVSGEHHETSGCLEIIYWKETKWDANGNPTEGRLMIDTPLSGKVSEEQTRITMSATTQAYFYAVRPLMATETDTKYDVALCMDDLTLTPSAQTRLRFDRLTVNKWLADESGKNMIYATHTLTPGQTLTVRLQLKNNSSKGYNVPFAEELLPEGVTLVDGELRHTNIAIRAGETVDLSYKIRVNDDVAGGTTMTFPKGKVLGLDTREITIRISDEVADASALTAITKTSDLPASMQKLAWQNLDFANQFYKTVLGKDISLPKTVEDWASQRLTTKSVRGQIAGVKDKILTVFVPIADIADEGNPSLTDAKQTSLNLAKLELPRTLIGRFLALNTDKFAVDSGLSTTSQTVYVTKKLDVFNRLFEVGWDEYYLPGDVFLVVKLDNPVYPQATTLDMSVGNAEIYIYLGNNKCVKHTAAGTTVETFDSTVGQCAWEGLFVALRPLTMS